MSANRDLRSAIVRSLRGLRGRRLALEAALETMSDEALRELMTALRELEDERDDERRKRRQGRFF